MVARAQSTWFWIACASIVLGCQSFNSDLLKHQQQRRSDTGPGTQIDITDAQVRDAGDAAIGPGLPDGSPIGMAGMGAAGMMGTAGSGGGLNGCVPNPLFGNVACPLICPEQCNGQDDDCDGTVDEDLENACKLDHATAACSQGRCLIVQCEEGFRDCDHEPGTGCEAPADDVNNCGSCGNRCVFAHAMAACTGGKCVATGCDALFANCDQKSGDCETSATTLMNCTACGKPCTDADVANASASCESGSCGVGQCFSGYGDCNGQASDGCEQALNTLDHCGACNTPCAFPGSINDCSSSVCLEQGCDPGYGECDNPANGCESLDTAQRCGACDRHCDTTLQNVQSASCQSQQCVVGCSTGFGDCDTDPSNGCEAIVTTLDRCGDCNTPCAAPNALMSCSTGSCQFVQCEDGYGNCNSNAIDADGCETSLNQDTHCGSCGNACPGGQVCSGGSCSNVMCPANMADCHSNGSCDVNITTDVMHCGSCTRACAFDNGVTPHASGGLSCNNGRCVPACDALFADCDRNYRNGCETPLTTLTDCGACGTGCSIPNANASCSSGSCRVSMCTGDFADCDNDGKSCETQLGTTQNCTGCMIACALPNAVPSCNGTAGNHSCGIASCSQSYFKDCDGKPGNGCEIDTRSDPKNCGNCGDDCTQDPNVKSATCSNGVCGYMCQPNFGNCNSMPGCETPLTTLTDCGSCGAGCARANGSADCSSGSCTLAGCNMGFLDCDGNPDDGCEPLTTLVNCGACGTPCAVQNGSASCTTGSCQVASCNSGFADCDGDPANGCERNTTSPASGGQGPCFPDTSGCTRQTYNGQDYFFCTMKRSWDDARAHCQQQLLGELAHIDDATEDAFVHANATQDSWIGGTDKAVEGTWRWANDNAIFYMGGSTVTYAHWNSGEPNNSGGNENCAEILAAGGWNDQACTDTRAFACEVQKDLCPNDPNKANPGQCGCGVPDTDTDGDGTADCNDGCPMDPNKIAPGACGCGTPDTDTDGDGTPDCHDGCPMDPNKTAAGVCGCGAPDTDTDNDGTPDCHDGCPQDPTRQATPCGLDYTPTNFDQSAINYGLSPSTTLNCGTTTIDTTGSVTITNWCGTMPTAVIQSQTNGPEVAVLPLQALTISSGATLRVVGTRPLILAVRGPVAISGTINARGTSTTPGAGGNVSCGSGNGGGGANDSNNNEGAGGGGGAAFGNNGGSGGSGDRSNGSTSGGSNGTSEGGSSLSPLRGGCSGGKGGNGSGTGGAGGGGGGAIQISALASLSVSSGAIVSASGGGGAAGSARRDGGGGGGSGGAVFFEAHVVTVSSGAWVTANGGGGASGQPNTSGGANPGSDGSANSNSTASGGSGNDAAGDGGRGAASNSAGSGGNGDCFGGIFCLGSTRGAAGGGGGGGVGRIRAHGTQSCSLNNGAFSPSVGATNCP